MPTFNRYTNPDGQFISQEEWYDDLFLTSISYYVTIMVPGIGADKYERINANTYPEAIAIAKYLIEEKDQQALVYFNTPVTMGLNIPRDKFEYYLNLYNTATGQKLRMPPWKNQLNPKTKG